MGIPLHKRIANNEAESSSNTKQLGSQLTDGKYIQLALLIIELDADGGLAGVAAGHQTYSSQDTPVIPNMNFAFTQWQGRVIHIMRHALI